MKNKSPILMALSALAVVLTPILANAQRSPVTGGHAQSISYHDRTPHAHEHYAVAHH